MTHDKAIFVISAESTFNGSGRCNSDELQEAKMLAYAALEKQIPKICASKDRIRGGQFWYTDYYCPSERCGQKLKWED